MMLPFARGVAEYNSVAFHDSRTARNPAFSFIPGSLKLLVNLLTLFPIDFRHK